MTAPLSLVDFLADSLGMQPNDIASFAAVRYGTDPDLDLPDEVAAAVRADLDVHCCRSVPAVWWPETGLDPFVCRCRAMGGLEHSPRPDCPLPPR